MWPFLAARFQELDLFPRYGRLASRGCASWHRPSAGSRVGRTAPASRRRRQRRVRRVERSRDVRREVGALWTFGIQHDMDLVAGSDAAVAAPSGAQQDPSPGTKRLDHCTNAHAVDGAGDVMLWLRPPCVVGIERHRNEDPFPLVCGHRGGEPHLIAHPGDAGTVSIRLRACGLRSLRQAGPEPVSRLACRPGCEPRRGADARPAPSTRSGAPRPGPSPVSPWKYSWNGMLSRQRGSVASRSYQPWTGRRPSGPGRKIDTSRPRDVVRRLADREPDARAGRVLHRSCRWRVGRSRASPRSAAR